MITPDMVISIQFVSVERCPKCDKLPFINKVRYLKDTPYICCCINCKTRYFVGATFDEAVDSWNNFAKSKNARD